MDYTESASPPLFFWIIAVLGFLIVSALYWSSWNQLRRWYTDARPSGTSFAYCSARIGFIRFRGELNVWVSVEGVWLKPLWLSLLSGHTVFIPWSDIPYIENAREALMFPMIVVWLSNSDIQLKFGLALGSNTVGDALLNHWEAYRARGSSQSA
jgi:hypothetical protein